MHRCTHKSKTKETQGACVYLSQAECRRITNFLLAICALISKNLLNSCMNVTKENEHVAISGPQMFLLFFLT